MNVIEVTIVVLRVVQDRTGSSGSPQDAANIAQFLANPANASFALLGAVSGIPFSHFFANSPNAFEALKAELWQSFLEELGNPEIPTPEWSFEHTVGQMASYLDAFV